MRSRSVIPGQTLEQNRYSCKLCRFLINSLYTVAPNSCKKNKYVCDLGFFHIKKNRIKDEYNYIIETICCNELVARGYRVYIGKTYKGEVDFIAEK